MRPPGYLAFEHTFDDGGTVAQEPGELPTDGLTKARASQEIERLHGETGRGA